MNMNFNIFKIYIIRCRLIDEQPTFYGLNEFKRFYNMMVMTGQTDN